MPVRYLSNEVLQLGSLGSHADHQAERQGRRIAWWQRWRSCGRQTTRL